jgi:hypothetical protein
MKLNETLITNSLSLLTQQTEALWDQQPVGGNKQAAMYRHKDYVIYVTYDPQEEAKRA